jgi:hypothetical protein
MKPKMSVPGGLAVAVAIAVVMGVSASAAGQDRGQGDQVVAGGGVSRGGDSGGGGAISRGGDSSGGGAVSRGGDSGGGASRGGDSGAAMPASSPRTASSPPRRSSDGAGSTRSGDGARATPRPREGREPVGRAVPRPDTQAAPGSGTTIVTGSSYYGGYYPWGYGGLGLGGYYGYYDPWWNDPYSYGQYYSSPWDGGLRLRVKPNQAEVFVDGYFAGVVDEFDNIFQKLRIESGPHRIEIREEGYEPLTFEVRILPDRTVTYRGELKRLP